MAAKGKRASRAQQRAALAGKAAGVVVPAHVDVCVIGGGAAGLVCGIVAAEGGRTVVVLERDATCGRTILATGNGRCNFANAHLDPAAYNEASFVAQATGPRWLDDVLDFFRACGLAWEEEAEGRLYPLSRQAASVRSVLLERAARAGATLVPLREVTGVAQAPTGFVVSYQELFGRRNPADLSADAVVLATGGGMPATCKGLGLRERSFSPLLCPLACSGPALDALDGRRAHARVALVRDGATVTAQRGEVLFRSYGLSGIVVFNLSRHALPGDELVLDLIPNLSLQEASRLAAHTLDGLLDPVIARALAREAQASPGRPDASAAPCALGLAKQLRYRVRGTTEEGHAQVHRGGLATSQFDPASLQAYDVPGLFACGEALDVDGPCGGYNLAWAWKSGLVCGTAATGRLI